MSELAAHIASGAEQRPQPSLERLVGECGLPLALESEPGEVVRDPAKVHDLLEHQEEFGDVGIAVGSKAGLVAWVVPSAEAAKYESRYPALLDAPCVEELSERTYLFRRGRHMRPPQGAPPDCILGLDDPDVVLVPPSRGRVWVREPDERRIQTWPFSHNPENWLVRSWKRSLRAIMESKKPSRPRSLVGEGLMPVGTLVFVYGEGGVGKSWFTMALARAVATGRTFLGWPTTQARVGILSAELDLHEFWERWEAIERIERASRHPGDPEPIEEMLRGRSRVFPFTADLGPLPDLRKEADRACLVEICQLHGLDMLILDPFALLHSAPENDNGPLLEVVRGLHEVAKQAQVAIVVVHHPKKDKSATGFDALRGGSVLGCHARVVLRLSKDRGRLKLACEKSTHAPKPDSIWLEQHQDGPLVAVTAPPDPTADRDRRNGDLLRVLKENGPRWATLDELRASVQSLRTVQPDTVRKRYLNPLVESGEAEVTGQTSARRWRYATRDEDSGHT